MRDPNRNIDMLLAQTQDPIAKSRIDAHFRVTTQKVTHNRDHIASAEQHGSAYRQISSQLRFAREESFFSLVRGGQNGAATFEIQRALFSKADPTRSAMKKHHPKAALEGRKDPNHRGQGSVEGVGGCGQATLPDNPHERFHGTKSVDDDDTTSTS